MTYTQSLTTIATKLHGNLHAAQSLNPESILINSATTSSRDVSQNTLFIAIQGTKHDGHTFVPHAVAQGAAAVVVEKIVAEISVPQIVVPHTGRAAGILAALFEGGLAQQLRPIAVTGTNGKTTTNYLVFEALQHLGERPIRFGTLGTFAEGVIDNPDTLTTPDAFSLHRDMRIASQAGCTAAVLEASSHALDQGRLEGVPIEIGIFTNITRDHLDYHGTMEHYLDAKMRLFELIYRHHGASGIAVINLDGAGGAEVHERVRTLGLTSCSFSRIAGRGEVTLQSFNQTLSSSTTVIQYQGKTVTIASPLIGEHNAENLTCAFCALVGRGYAPERVANALSQVRGVPGRLQPVGASDIGIYVDYAHTPDALERALKTLRPITDKDIWVVFGCGGDRDRGKRPIMGKIASSLADQVIVTSDNPRTEDPDAIIDDIAPGVEGGYLRVSDRTSAIYHAVAHAIPGDIILIAGKGHEDYQIIGTTKSYFSDVAVAQAAVEQRYADNAHQR
jgi:UDP-N-acetylmuramoyl-L-alanyl-D-glutamate--2,6-diaminopimelate ligase